MTKHTPGPWKSEGLHRYPNGQRSGRPYVFAPNANEPYRHVCELFTDPPETDANAALIATAPDMLKELETLESLADAIEEGRHSPAVVDWHKTRNILRELIARAKGEI